MKILVVVLGLICFSNGAFAGDSFFGPIIRNVAYKNLYVPNGFDSNDTVQFVADGIFPNACYKIAQPRVWVEDKKKVINVEARAYFYNGLCASVLIPFQQVIHVGIIRTPGKYDIMDGEGQIVGSVDIKPATSSLEDDFLYAPVHKINVVQNENGNHKVELKIEFNQSCMKMKEVKVSYEPNVVVVQPIAQILSEKECAVGYYPETVEVELKGLEKDKRYLIHVRSSGSQALNEILVN